MATIITSECINCGACEPECPNTAIYAGGAPWELNGESHPAIAEDIYYIVPSKCSECVGFFEHEACAAVCPVDCCVPDPNNPESHEVLLARAREVHPELTIPDDAPSRFRKGQAAAAPKAEAAAVAASDGAAAVTTNGVSPTAEAGVTPAVAEATEAAGPGLSAPAPTPKPAAPPPPPPPQPAAKPTATVPKPAPAAPPKPAPAAAPPPAAPAPVRTPMPAPVAMINLPKDAGALPGPIGEKHFPGETDEDFESVLASVDLTQVREAPLIVKIALRLAEPILGALPDRPKLELERQVGDLRGFSRIRSTALNMVLNAFLYAALLFVFGVTVRGNLVFSQSAGGWILLGTLIAAVETVWRLREGILGERPAVEMTYRSSLYGILLAPLGTLLVGGGKRRRHSVRKVAFDGFTVDLHDEKTERDRRYGTVYTTSEHANAYLVRLEMPRKVPQSSLKRLWNLPEEMPDYDYNISLADDVLTIAASVRGEALRRLSSVSPSFPADFQTRIDFDKPVATFRHRLRNKVIEIIVLKEGAGEMQAAA